MRRADHLSRRTAHKFSKIASPWNFFRPKYVENSNVISANYSDVAKRLGVSAAKLQLGVERCVCRVM
jgi:hypothetical protein